MEDAFRIISDHGIRISSFNMIGLPGETRADVFETIELNRRLKVKTANVYIVYPFPGSRMSKDYGVVYKDRRGRIIPMSRASRFGLSAMTRKEVEGLRKTFNLYLSLPKSLWPVVETAEGSGRKNHLILESLTQFAQAMEG
jgi:anaerobic magnesium-protoporphyrin IX monomethyl ester cyclase